MIERQGDKLVLWCECCSPAKKMAEVKVWLIEIVGWHAGKKHSIRVTLDEVLTYHSPAS